MKAILWRALIRYQLHHRWQLALSILGVALGVAVVVAVDLANDGAQRAYTEAAHTIAGRTTHQLIGGPQGLDENLYRHLRVELAMRASAPVVEAYGRLPEHAATRVRMLGVDPFAEAPFRDYTRAGGGNNILPRLVGTADSVMTTAATAQRLGTRVNDSVILETGGRQRRLTLIGLLELDDPLIEQALDDVFIVDVATAQDVLGRPGYLSRIDLIIDDDAALLQRLRAWLPRAQPCCRRNRASSI